jgi:FkbM family methyltransferase
VIISYAQNFEDVMLWRALKHVEAGFYIDVGANDPTIDSVTRLFYERGWRGINIEPLRSHIMDLERERPRDINIGAAAGAAIGEIALWECDVRGWATADETVMAQHRANGHSGHSSRVPITTLSAICADHAPHDIHFLKIDVEGFERSVLEGMDLRRFRPWIVVVEATRPNTVEEVHDQWEELVVTAGYRFIYADGVNRFYVACEHSELATAFRHPPNIFDGFVRAPLIEADSWAETVIARADAIAAEAAVRSAEADARSTIAEERTAVSEARAANAEARTAIAERRAADAEARTAVAERRASEAEASISAARAQAAKAERSAADAQLRADRAEIHVTALMNSTSWRVTRPIRLFGRVVRASDREFHNARARRNISARVAEHRHGRRAHDDAGACPRSGDLCAVERADRRLRARSAGHTGANPTSQACLCFSLAAGSQWHRRLQR